jgi:hypothetical protein
MAPPQDDEPPDSEQKRSFPGLSRRALLALGLFGTAGGLAATQLSQPPMNDVPPNQTPEPPQIADPERTSMRFASPGDVQAAIDRAAEQPQGRVHLYPETTYEMTSTWQVKSGVTLDYNGANLVVRRDVDIHDIQPSGCVEQPVVDLQNVRGKFTSSVFKFDSRRHGFYGPGPSWYVRGGITHGRQGEGTLYEFAQGGESAIYFVHADHAVWNIGTVVDMHRGDAFGINGNRIYGLWYGFDTGIHMHNRKRPSRKVDNISGNHFDVIAQPIESRILWDLEAGHYNVLRGRLWDFSRYSDVMWRIHDEDAASRIGNILHWFPIGGDEAQLTETVGPKVFEDQLGDPRNRIIVPWMQGRPVSDFA